MPIDKMDKEIIKKLKDREYTPSSSAWERLSTQLDEHKVRKKRRRFQIASAASILLLLGLTSIYFFKSTDTPLPQEIIVNTEIDNTIQEKELQIESILEFKEELVADNEEIVEKTFYVALYNELFINGEKSIGDGREVDLFDRNRLYTAIGYVLKPGLMTQFGIMRQTTSNWSKNQLQISLHHTF